MEVSELRFSKADNDRIGGKVLMQEYLRWRPRPVRFAPAENFDPDYAATLMRIRGPKAYEDYCAQFVEEAPETNLPKLQVFGDAHPPSWDEYGICPEFIKAIPLCVYPQDGATGNKEDVAEFDGDDPYDGSRYGIKAVDRYFNRSKKTHEAIQAKEEILEDFNKTKDYTTLHRRMEKLERNKPSKAIRRFHRVRQSSRIF